MKRFLAALLAACMIFALAGCGAVAEGISQEEYDALKSQYDELKEKYEALEGEYSQAKSDSAYWEQCWKDMRDKYNQLKSDSETEPEPEPVVEEEPADGDIYGLSVTCYEEGQYKVGKDIPAGEYVLLTTRLSGYFEVSEDANGSEIIFNENFDTNSVITVYEGEYLTLSRCIAVPESEYHSKYVINYSDNTGVMLMVGTDIPTGEYRVTSEDGKMGYYCIFESSRQDKIIANDNFENSVYVSVKEGQYLVLNRCYISE